MSIKSQILKIVILGERKVGKTSFRKSFIGNSRIDYFMSAPADFANSDLSLKIQGQEHNVQLQIWDLVNVNYSHISTCLPHQGILKGSSGSVVMFDITNQDSLTQVNNHISFLFSKLNKKIPIIVVGNKSDLRNSDENLAFVSQELINQTLKTLNKDHHQIQISYEEVSSHNEKQVELAFSHLTQAILVHLMKDKKQLF